MSETGKRSRPGNLNRSEQTAAKPFISSQFTGDIDLTRISEGSSNPRAEVFLQGWAHGWEARQPEIDRLNWTLDRQYVVMWNPVKIDPNRPTFAELLRIRGDLERAAQVEADLAIVFGEVKR